MIRAIRSVIGLLFLGTTLLTLPACERNKDTKPDVAQVVKPKTPPPSYAAFAKSYNDRLKWLDRLWSRVTLRIKGTDAEGKEFDEQAEGHLQVIRPRKLALTIMKLGETYYYLGCNDKLYWWLDVKEEKAALDGSHERATPEFTDQFALPVHPLDLIDVLGVSPLPTKGSTAWSRDARYVEVTIPGRWGTTRLSVEPDTFRARRAVLTDASGLELLRAELEKDEKVSVRCSDDRPEIAGVYRLTLPGSDTTVTIRLSDPENRCDRQKETPFDLPTLLKSFNIRNVQRLDEGVGTVAGLPG